MSVSSAPELLRYAATLIDQRANSRDRPAERSMKSAVNAFNALTAQSMTELQGWVFMAVLKLARAQAGTLNPADYLDGAAYLALALEHALGSPGGDSPPAVHAGLPKATASHRDDSGPAEADYQGRARILQEWKARDA